MQLLHEAELTLRSAGFSTERSGDFEEGILFEDDSVLGFAVVLAAVEDIVAEWREIQDRFLRRHASQLRKDPSKAWSTYSVFLTSAVVDQPTWDTLGIESDVNATRKIVRGGIITRADLYQALAPILPLSLGLNIPQESAFASLSVKLDSDERQLFDLMSEHGEERIAVTWLVGAGQ